MLTITTSSTIGPETVCFQRTPFGVGDGKAPFLLFGGDGAMTEMRPVTWADTLEEAEMKAAAYLTLFPDGACYVLQALSHHVSGASVPREPR